MDQPEAVDGGRFGSANAVDNLGAQNLLLFLLLLPARLPFIHVAGDRRFNRSSPSPELRLTDACGKERIGFPQVGGAYLSEIPHPVDPEIWKRCCIFRLLLVRSIGGTE
jgi:hypothetical protein